MKFTSKMLVALAAVGVMAAPPTPPGEKYRIEVILGKQRVDVGDLDWQHETRDIIYSSPDNLIGIQHAPSEPLLSFADQCTSHADTVGHRHVYIKMEGAWGHLDGLGPIEARERLIDAVVKTLHADSDYTGYNVFTNCWGTTWQEGVPHWKGPHACGGRDPTVRPDCMCGIGSAQCEFHSWGHLLPSVISARVYRGTQSEPEVAYLKIEFKSDKIEKVEKDCGPIGKISSKVVGFLPGPGSLFSTAIDIFCD